MRTVAVASAGLVAAVAVPTVVVAVATVVDIALEEVVEEMAVAMVVVAPVAVDTAYIHPFNLIYIKYNERTRLQYKRAVFISINETVVVSRTGLLYQR